MKKIYPITLLVLFLGLTIFVYAQEATQEQTTTSTNQLIKKAPLLKQKNDFYFKIEHDEGLRRVINANKERNEIIEPYLKEIKNNKREEIEKKKAEFQQRLSQIKNQRHQQLTEKLSKNINNTNQNISNATLRYLSALENILNKIEERTRLIEEKTNQELTQIIQQIEEVRQNLSQAKEVVNLQKSKEHVIKITSENNLGQDIKKTITELRNDHKNIRENIIKPLRESIQNITTMLKNEVQRLRTQESSFSEE